MSRAIAVLLLLAFTVTALMGTPPDSTAQQGLSAVEIPDGESPAEIRTLIDLLGHPTFRVRERAQRRLTGLGEAAVPFLRGALAADDQEIVYRARAILTQVGEDFFVLCSLLTSREPAVRGYAEESLLRRFLAEPETTSQPRQLSASSSMVIVRGGARVLRLAGPGFVMQQATPVPMEAQPLAGQADHREDEPRLLTPCALLERIVTQVPGVLVDPRVADIEGFFRDHVELTPEQLNDGPGLLGILQQLELVTQQPIQLGQTRIVVVVPRGADFEEGPGAVLQTCRGLLHHRPRIRGLCALSLGMTFPQNREFAQMCVNSLRRDAHPCRDELLAALGSGTLAFREFYPDGVVPDLAQALVRMLTDTAEPFATRFAAANALAGWVPQSVPGADAEETALFESRLADYRSLVLQPLLAAVTPARETEGEESPASLLGRDLALWALGRAGVADAAVVEAIAGSLAASAPPLLAMETAALDTPLAAPLHTLSLHAIQALAQLGSPETPAATLELALALALHDEATGGYFAAVLALIDRCGEEAQWEVLHAPYAARLSRALHPLDHLPPADAESLHIVTAEETLTDIAEQYYGVASMPFWRAIVAANPGIEPSALEPGTELRIPALDEDLRALRETVARTDAGVTTRGFLAAALGSLPWTAAHVPTAVDHILSEPSDDIAQLWINRLTAQSLEPSEAEWDRFRTVLTAPGDDPETATVQATRVTRFLGAWQPEGAVERVSTILLDVREPARRVGLMILMARLGADDHLQEIEDILFGDDYTLAQRTAREVGSYLPNRALEWLRRMSTQNPMNTRLCALDGLDAFGQALALAGDSRRLQEAQSILYDLSDDPKPAVSRRAQEVLSAFREYRMEAEMALRSRYVPGESEVTILPPRLPIPSWA